jgi:hypothetical protein
MYLALILRIVKVRITIDSFQCNEMNQKEKVEERAGLSSEIEELCTWLLRLFPLECYNDDNYQDNAA